MGYAAAAPMPLKLSVRRPDRSNTNREIEMKRFQKVLYSLPPFLLASIASVLTVAQVVLAFFLHGRNSEALQWAGWICSSGLDGFACGLRECLAYCQSSRSAERVVCLREKAT